MSGDHGDGIDPSTHPLPPGMDPSKVTAWGYGSPDPSTHWPIQPLFGLRLLLEPGREPCGRCGVPLDLLPGHHYTLMTDDQPVVCGQCREAMLAEVGP